MNTLHCYRRRADAYREARTFWRLYIIACTALVLLGTVGGWIGMAIGRAGL
jgi:hypothetical protein